MKNKIALALTLACGSLSLNSLASDSSSRYSFENVRGPLGKAAVVTAVVCLAPAVVKAVRGGAEWTRGTANVATGTVNIATDVVANGAVEVTRALTDAASSRTGRYVAVGAVAGIVAAFFAKKA